MAYAWRTVTAIVVLATAGALVARSAKAQTASPSLTVVIHDYSALPLEVLERAKGITTTIYRQIDVQVNWWDANRFAAEVTTVLAARPVLTASVLHVRLFRSSPANGPRPANGELAHAVPGSQYASVLVQRVEYVASHGGQDFVTLLGHVMAHEIGHLLLPPNSHSAAGIMAATMDLFLVDHGGLSFDLRQAAAIRARVASMSDLQ
jgi:hypothetical protein